jgi:hypothetical protein
MHTHVHTGPMPVSFFIHQESRVSASLSPSMLARRQEYLRTMLCERSDVVAPPKFTCFPCPDPLEQEQEEASHDDTRDADGVGGSSMSTAMTLLYALVVNDARIEYEAYMHACGMPAVDWACQEVEGKRRRVEHIGSHANKDSDQGTHSDTQGAVSGTHARSDGHNNQDHYCEAAHSAGGHARGGRHSDSHRTRCNIVQRRHLHCNKSNGSFVYKRKRNLTCCSGDLVLLLHTLAACEGGIGGHVNALAEALLDRE